MSGAILTVLFLVFRKQPKPEPAAYIPSTTDGIPLLRYSELPSIILKDHLQNPKPTGTLTLQNLLAMTPAELWMQDVGEMNLVCAQGLNGSEDLNLKEALQTLDKWTERVRSETEKNMHRFYEHHEAFQDCEPFFRVGLLISVLQKDFGVHYDVDQYRLCMESREAQKRGEHIGSEDVFRDSKLMFINGTVSPDGKGTCASLPVAYLTVARRLGYPVRLVAAKHHFFIRWEDEKARINFDGSGFGFNCYSDDFYKKWPYPITQKEIQDGFYLKSMTPAEELGAFLFFRTQCLRVAGRKDEGHDMIARAATLWNHHPLTDEATRDLWHTGFLTVREKESRMQCLRGAMFSLSCQGVTPQRVADLQRQFTMIQNSPCGGPDDLNQIESLERRISFEIGWVAEEKRAKLDLEVSRSYAAANFGGKEAYEKRLMDDPQFARQEKQKDEARLRRLDDERKIQEQNESLLSDPDYPVPKQTGPPSQPPWQRSDSYENKLSP